MHMPTMGELTPSDWTAELERNGRVVFPLRRRPSAVRAAVILLLLTPNTVLSIVEFAEESTVGRIFDVVGFTGYALILGGILWLLVTRRPIVVVDSEGIRSGRRFMPWAGVGTAGIPTGTPLLRSLPILPANVRDKQLSILQDNVRDLSAFSTWLNSLRPTERERHADHG
jgi:hypothetical protein